MEYNLEIVSAGMEYLEIISASDDDDDMDLCQTEDEDATNTNTNNVVPETDDDTDEDSDEDELVDPDDEELIAELRREARKHEAEVFRREFIYGGSNNSIDKKTLVCRPWGGGGSVTCSRMEKSSGIVWIGVHGKDSICVVTSRKTAGVLDLTIGYLKQLTEETILRRFRKTVLSELEDLAIWLCGGFGNNSKPFGVVSVIHDDNDNDDLQVHEATKFLLEKMEAEGCYTTVDKTVKTAISGFQILFQKDKKFKANEIEVSVVDPKLFLSDEDDSNFKDIYVKHLLMSEIEEHLAAINGPAAGSR